jgi:hypothetical protein
MKRTVLSLLALALILVFGYVSFSRVSSPSQVSVQHYGSDRYGLSFEYPATYRLQESDSPSGERLRHTITLTRAADLPLPEAGEGPPTITIDLYQNDRDAYTTERWIRDSSSSNFKLGAERLATTTISGSEALSYRWSGLYEGTTIAIARPAWVYAFTVTYMQPGDDIVQDFVRVRDSVRLAP